MAKEDVQVIYEDHEDEYWMKPLREAVTNLGNSWAGAVMRRDHYAHEMANNAANRAHQAYLAQMQIRSTEKVEGMKLGAQVARHKILDQQNKKNFEIHKKTSVREEKKWQQEQLEYDRSIASSKAVNELMRANNEFIIDPSGNITIAKLSVDDRKDLMDQMAMAPAINATFRPGIQKYKKRQQTIAGRLNFLRTLQKKKGNESVISHILKTEQPVTILNLMGGKEANPKGHSDLQALGSEVMDDDTWSEILDSYGIDSGTVTGLKKHEWDGGIDHGRMLTQTGLNRTQHPFSPNDYIQNGRTKDYHKAATHLKKPFSATDKDNSALMAAVNNLDIGFQGLAKDTTDVLSGAAMRFMQENAVYFTAPEKLTSTMRARITKVAQLGPDANFTDNTVTIQSGKNKGKVRTLKADLVDDVDKQIHNLMFGDGDPATKAKQANAIMRSFVKGQNWHKGGKARGIQSVVGDDKSIATMFDGDAGSSVAGPDVTDKTGDLSLVTTSGGDQGYGELQADDAVPTEVNIKSFLEAFPNDDLLADMTGNETMGGIANGIVLDGGTINMSKIPVDQWQQVIFGGGVDTPEEKFFTNKLRNMQAVVDKYADNPDEDYYRYGLGIDSAYLLDTKKGQKLSQGNKTFEHLRDWYHTNQKIAEQIMLNKPEILFTQTGDPKAWMRTTLDKTDFNDRIDWKTIEPNFKNAPNPKEVEKQWRFIFQSLGIGEDAIDDGTYFGIGHRIRRLAESALPEGDTRKSKFFNPSGRTFNFNNRVFGAMGN